MTSRPNLMHGGYGGRLPPPTGPLLRDVQIARRLSGWEAFADDNR